MKQQDIFSTKEFKAHVKSDKKIRAKPKKHEENIQMQLCRYVKMKHPDVIFECDLASGTKLTIGQAVKAKAMRSHRGMPDFRIFENSNGFNGLFLELKKDGTKLFKKNGEFVDEHIREQADIINRLTKQGYYAFFAIGLNTAISHVETFLLEK